MKKLTFVFMMLALPVAAMGQATYYGSPAAFAAATAGYSQIGGVEDFEETPPGAGILGFDDPLVQGVANGPFPAGIIENLEVQCNQGGINPVAPFPRGVGGTGLVFVELGSGFGEVSDLVIANTFVDSLDILTPDAPMAMDFDMVTLLGGTTGQLVVFDTNNVQIGLFAVGVSAPGVYGGIVSTVPIGRINVFDTGGGAEGFDNVAQYVPEPASLLLVVAGLVALRRR